MTNTIDTPERLYFGCWGSSKGHWLRNEYGQKIPFDHNKNRFSIINSAKIDGHFAPKGDRRQGAAKLWHTGVWTILALHDYSRDDRPGSNAVFLLRGTHDADTVLADAREHFTDQITRIEAKGPIKIVEQNT